MYNKLTIDELLDINNKDQPIINNKPNQPNQQEENKTKLMYYGGGKVCKRKDNEQNIIGIILIILIIIFIIYKLSKNLKNNTKDINFFNFTKNHDIIKLLIGLLLINHVRLLSTSLINTIILPILEPIIPLLECNLNIKYYDTTIELGKFMTDLLVFILNIIILYILYILLNNIF